MENKNKSIMLNIVSLLVITAVFFGMRGNTNEEPQEIPVERNIEVTTVEQTTEKHHEEIKLIATAYCPCEKCCGKWARSRQGSPRGASGEELISGVSIAVDTEVFPYGTVIVIDGKEYIAHDCGGKVKGNRIDIYFDNHEDAVRFGKQTLKGYVKE